MNKISYISIDTERAFYGSKDTEFSFITIAGPADGESAFKESKNLNIHCSKFYLRYPFWHNDNLKIYNSYFYDTCRAALWYDNNLEIHNCISYGIKAVRECKNVVLTDDEFHSDELGWKSDRISAFNSKIYGNYLFFSSNNVSLNKCEIYGKYTFQYINNLKISNTYLNTKDAFWHSKNVLITNCVVKGEYLAWYSENITFINCKIIGTQPLCYVKGLKLINCEFIDADLSLEYSEVSGNITCKNSSIKNPKIGYLKVSGDYKIIVDENDRSNGLFKFIK